MGIRKGELVFDDDWKDNDALFNPVVDGEPKARGAVPRDFSVQPREMMAPPSGIKLIDQSNWSAIIKEKEREKSNLSDIRLRGDRGNPIPSLDQGQVGYCWAHSPAHAITIERAVRNAPYVPLSAYSIAAIIKNGRDEGGWCGLAGQFASEKGIASQSKWAQGNRNVQLATPEMLQHMLTHRVTNSWMDLTSQAWDRNLTFNQLVSLLLSNIPCPVDFNWWGHSVCALDVVEVEPGSFGIRIWNSWGDSWSDRGMGILRGSKAHPDGALAINSSIVSTT